jgi:ferric-dicitrate binding protein FerR (iron transport regulator)
LSTNSRKQALLLKYLNNDCSHAELKELFDYLQSDKGDDVGSYGEVMDDLWSKIHEERTLDDEKAERLIKDTIQVDEFIRLRPLRLFRRYRVAAAVLALVIVTGSIYFFSTKKNQPVRLAQEASEPYKNDIKPGGTKAILQAGSVQVALHKEDTSFLLAGNVVHINGGNVRVTDIKPVQYTLITPRGGEYSLVLSDGTKVWINANSKLIYSSIFKGDSRDVYLTGEAYFKVKTDADHPFVVHTEKQNIRVLGTEFNIQAYPDENESVTTLVDGKVQVNSFGKEMVLKQGQQAISGNDGQFRFQPDADVEQAIAWKNGYFRFDNTDIYEIMRQLSRWYNVKVSFEKDIQPREFLAIISRNNNISQVLKMLEGTGEIHFKIDTGKVTVMP